jgi:protocatechuate 3,4-dioxygenase, beta subunit
VQPVNPSARRVFLGTCGALGLSAFTVRGAFAAELMRTPKQTEGPFYPDKLPLDTDNDLLVVNDGITPAVGTVAHFSGKILDLKGSPVRNALVEIWQCDNSGAYLHSGSDNGAKRDKNFQGFGRFLTGSTGEYYFRTIKPVPYTGRTPHIHVKVKKGGKELLTTQLFINGYPQNKTDGVLGGVRDPLERELVMVDFKPLKDSKIGELSARFDVVVGLTPDEHRRR